NPFDTTDLADGAHTLRSLVDLRDGSQLSFETTFTVANDGPPNDAPQLASIGDQALLVGDSAALLISASDANGDPLSFSSSALPAFASMSDNGDGTAILTLTPGVGDLGDHSITVNVSDGQLNDSETFIVSVSEPLDNLAPQLNPIGNQTLLVGASAVVAITASDLNGDPLSFTSSLLPAFAS
ncbi:cadherin-like domain-containing protein, partial [endosymbiont of Tevnia jerichonana]